MKNKYLSLIKKYVYPITFCDTKYTNFSYRCALSFNGREVICCSYEDELTSNKSLKLIFLTNSQDRCEHYREDFLTNRYKS